MALTEIMTDSDGLAAFLAGKGLPAEVYVAEKAAAQAQAPVLCPELEYSWTRDQLEPDVRERAVERVLEIGGDYGFPVDFVVEVLRGFRPDLTAGEVRDEVYRLVELAADVRRYATRGRRESEEAAAELYGNALADFAHQPVTS